MSEHRGETKPGVLLVDDVEANLVALEAQLEDMNCEVVRARSGNEALGKLLKREFAVVLLDVHMPGMDGFEVARYMRGNASTRDVAIVFLTATNASEDSALVGYESGAVDYLSKPINARILRSKVQVFLDLYIGRRKLAALVGELEFRNADLLRTSRELEASNAALQQAEREGRSKSEQLARINKDLEAFVYTVSHDLKEPLRGLDAFSRFLLDDYAGLLDDQGKRYLELLRDSSTRMTQLIDDLLRFARVGRQRTPLVPVDLAALAREALQEIRFSADEAGARIEVPADLPTVPGYPVLIRQLFANLIGNALKYRRADVSPHVVVAGRGIPGGVELTIADNGIGVPAEHREMVFGLFQRLHRREEYTGTGVGLALCKKIVEEHGGTIGIEETPGGGCTVRVTLCARGHDGDACAAAAAAEA